MNQKPDAENNLHHWLSTELMYNFTFEMFTIHVKHVTFVAKDEKDFCWYATYLYSFRSISNATFAEEFQVLVITCTAVVPEDSLVKRFLGHAHTIVFDKVGKCWQMVSLFKTLWGKGNIINRMSVGIFSWKTRENICALWYFLR